MIARRWVVLLLAVVTAGCSSSTLFPKPVTISTRIDAVHRVTRVKDLAISRCDNVFFVVPVTSSPQKAYAELLDEARAAGGNALVDVKVRDDGGIVVPPFWIRACWQATATAAIVE